MQAALITVSIFILISYFFIGIIIGWVTKDKIFRTQIYSHPEMFDQNGNIIPDEILAVRFENDYDYDDEETEE
jgi:hypothetical protein